MNVQKYGSKIKIEDGYFLTKMTGDECLLDMSDVTEISSSFLGALMHLKKEKNIKLLVSNYVLGVFDMLGIRSFFDENIIVIDNKEIKGD